MISENNVSIIRVFDHDILICIMFISQIENVMPPIWHSLNYLKSMLNKTTSNN